jgi:hypothetical protein
MSGNNFTGITGITGQTGVMGIIGTTGVTGIIASGIIASGTNNVVIGGGYSTVSSGIITGYSSPSTCYPYIVGSGKCHFGKYSNVVRKATVITASDRDIDLSEVTNNSGELLTEENVNGSVFIASDNCIWIETSEKGKYMNLVELMKDYVEIKKTQSEYQDMITELYYAPPYGPGYLKSQTSFQSTLKDINQDDMSDEEDDQLNDCNTEDEESPQTIVNKCLII